MRVAELIAPLTFRLTDMPIEDPGPGEVQVRIEAVGVCGSDLHAYSEGAVGGTPNVNTMVLGQSTLEPFRTTAFNSMAATLSIESNYLHSISRDFNKRLNLVRDQVLYLKSSS